MSLDPTSDPGGSPGSQAPGPVAAALARSGVSAGLGCFRVDDDGRIHGRDPRVKLGADPGKLPFSAQAGEARRLSREIIAVTRALPHGQIHVSEFQDMRRTAERAPPDPVTPSGVMATVAAKLLDFKPYLALLGRAPDIGLRRKPAGD